ILPELGDKLGRYADKKLRERGVEIHAKTKVAAVRPNEIELSNGERITSSTLLWTAGVSPNPALDLVACPKERGRITVNANLEVFFSKDFVQYLDQRALAHTQTETRTAPWNREQLSVPDKGDNPEMIGARETVRSRIAA